jgi:hypothetical protein
MAQQFKVRRICTFLFRRRVETRHGLLEKDFKLSETGLGFSRGK